MGRLWKPSPSDVGMVAGCGRGAAGGSGALGVLEPADLFPASLLPSLETSSLRNLDCSSCVHMSTMLKSRRNSRSVSMVCGCICTNQAFPGSLLNTVSTRFTWKHFLLLLVMAVFSRPLAKRTQCNSSAVSELQVCRLDLTLWQRTLQERVPDKQTLIPGHGCLVTASTPIFWWLL